MKHEQADIDRYFENLKLTQELSNDEQDIGGSYADC